MTRTQASILDEDQGHAAAGAMLADAVLDRALDGHRLEQCAYDDGTPRAVTPTLRRLTERGPVLFVFLRHYG